MFCHCLKFLNIIILKKIYKHLVYVDTVKPVKLATLIS